MPLPNLSIGTTEELAGSVAGEIVDGIERAAIDGRPYVLGCPGGRTPRPLYQALCDLVRERATDLGHVIIAMMDDYAEQTAPGEFRRVDERAHYSCVRFGREEIVAPLNEATSGEGIADDRLWLPDPSCPEAYEERLRGVGGIDLFLLASGASDGHVALNPPGSPADSITRVVPLADSTRRDNLHTFPDFASLDEVPTHGVTVGIWSIVEHSRRTVMLVFGEQKRMAFRHLVRADSYDPAWPATVISLARDGSLMADTAATGAPDGRIRLGVIGLGLIAQAVHLSNLHTLRELFEIVHFCDLSPTLARTIGSEWGAADGVPPRVSTDADEVLANPEVDAVLILTPGSHAYLTRRALEAGKHVLAEKPLAHTMREAAELADLAEARGLVLQVGYMKMHDPIMARARAELARLGELRLVRVTVLHPDDDPQYEHHRYLRFRDADLSRVTELNAYEEARVSEAIGDVEPFRSLYRDVLMGSTVHEMGVLRALFGEAPLEICYAQMGASTVGEPLSAPPQVQALGRLGSAQFSLSWNWLPDYPEYGEEVVVFGSEGRLTLRLPAPYVRDHRAELVVEAMSGAERSTDHLVSEYLTGFVHELLAFREGILHGAQIVSGARGVVWDNRGLQDVAAALAATAGAGVGGEAARSER